MRLTPAQVLTLGFAGLILAGATLLSLPVASASGASTPFVDALFTATSAVCVTGLTVLNTATHWSGFGQAVILSLIQAGGLGIIVMSTLLAFALRTRISLRQRLLIGEAFGVGRIGGIVALVQRTLSLTVSIEAAGALILSVRWAVDMPLGQAVYFGVFHAISAFCNAGFDLFGDSLESYRFDAVVLLTVAGLIIVGGLGFDTLREVANWVRGRAVSLHSRLALGVTAGLLAFGTVVAWLLERENPATFGAMAWPWQWLNAFFLSVTARTAGYNSVPTGLLTAATLFMVVGLMFVGASPASTGGGIKTTTFGVLLASALAAVRGHPDVEVDGRRLPYELVGRALALTLIAGALVAATTMLLVIGDGVPFLEALFEATSAFGTVGLSTGVTPKLSLLGKITLALAMYAGRVGPLTLAVALAQRAAAMQTRVRYPEERVSVG